MSVYGALTELPATEESPCVPISFYGVSKYSSEQYLRIYAKLGVPSVALRFFNVYGPGQNLDNLRQGMVSIYLSQALRNKHIEVRGSGDRFRDFVYIDDVVDALCRSLDYSGEEVQRLNVCSSRRTTVAELIEQLQVCLPEAVPVTYAGSTAGDVNGCYGSAERAAVVLGWKARVELKDGLQKMVSRYLPLGS
jgi:UDP-glucose 4-epimerase